MRSKLFIAVLVTALTGCAHKLGSEEYQLSKLGPPLELPPGLSAPVTDAGIKDLEAGATRSARYSDVMCDCKNGDKAAPVAPEGQSAPEPAEPPQP
ncbi:MAG: hypothetical protein A2V90_01425 [Gammaproteobacteria bacterium RBG_16_57_12]|nr:MAG: hypothetical protein A2V90_01425 [Gammaproteobacteria bacterium RBG_16_57_12]